MAYDQRVIVSLQDSGTVYADGSGIYNVRMKGLAGIRATLRLWHEDAVKMVQMGVFDWYD